MAVGPCLIAEYACFVDRQCRQCLEAVRAVGRPSTVVFSNSTKTDAFHSSECTATDPDLLIDLTNECAGTSFPHCTFYKQQCASVSECASCLAKLVAGDGALAARQCSGFDLAARTLLNTVNLCVESDAAACSFWRQRCVDDANCGACLACMGESNSLSDIAADWSTPACHTAIQNNGLTVQYLESISRACTGINACRKGMTACVDVNGDGCIACVNGSAPPHPSQLLYVSVPAV